MSGKFEYELDKFMKIVPELQTALEQIMGKEWKGYGTTYDDKLNSLKIYTENVKEEIEWQKKRGLALEVTDRFLAGLDKIIKESTLIKLEGQRLTIGSAVKELSESMKQQMQVYQQNTEKAIESIVETYEQANKALPPPSQTQTDQGGITGIVTYGDCIRQHPDGRPGPSRCLATYVEDGTRKMQCIVAYAAQNPGDEGFARLSFQIFHGDLLKAGGCPQYESRDIIPRLPLIGWLGYKPIKCAFAKGEPKKR